MPRAVEFQVRSSDDAGTIESKTFVGPDGTPNTYYSGFYEELGSVGSFKIWEQYAQYRAYLYGPAYPSESDPFLDSAGFIGNLSSFFDDTVADYSAGTFVESVSLFPPTEGSGYLGLSRSSSGGYFKSGLYTSGIIDGETQKVWYKLAWDVPENLDATLDNAMLALYHMDGGFADASPNGKNGVGSGVDFTGLAKLGTRSARFTGASHADVGSLTGSEAKTIEFWIKNATLNDGILQIANDATNVTYLSLVDGLVMATGVPGGTYTLYVNGSGESRRLLSGWNHVALVSDAPMPLSQFTIGRANGDFMTGSLDEMAIYSRALDVAEVKGRYTAGRRASAGRLRLQVRSGDTLPLTSTFIGDDGTALDWFEVSQHKGVKIHGSVYNKRYFQYRAHFEGDGESTPSLGSVRVTDVTEELLFEHSSLSDMDEGEMDGGKIQWVGDEIGRPVLATVPGLVNIRSPAAGLASLWHMDEPEWLPGATVIDAAAGQDGTPQGDVQPSVFSKVGFAAGSFDGVDDFVIAPGGNLGGDFSICAWFKSSDTRRSAIVARSDGSVVVELNGDGSGASVGRLAFSVSSGTPKQVVASVDGLNDGVWHHVTAVRNGDHIYIYVDGVACGAAFLGTGYGGLGVSDFWFGSHPTASMFKGSIDEIAFYTRALSDADVHTILASGVDKDGTGEFISRRLDAGQPAIWESIEWAEGAAYGKFLPALGGDTIALWQMNETSGVVVADSGGESLDGTIVGSVSHASDGRFGGGLDFAGGHVDVPDSILLDAGQVCVEAWVKLTATDSRMLFDRRSGGGGYALGLDADSKPFFEVGGATCTANSGVQADQWCHVVGTYDEDTIRVYVNGLVAGILNAGVVSTDGGVGRIGAALGGGQTCNGLLDAVAVHAVPLTGEDIMGRASAGFARLRVQVRISNDPTFADATYQGPDGTEATYFNVPGESMVGRVPLGRYFQAKVLLDTENPQHRPLFQGMIVNQSAYPTHYPWVAPAQNQGQEFIGKLLTFEHQMATNLDTSVRYQLSGDNGTNWYYWNGGEWADVPVTSNMWLYANEWTEINDHIGSVYEQLYAKVGGIVKFRALLSSPGDLQVAVDQVSLTISEGALVLESPNGDETGEKAWVVGVPYDITWSSGGTVSDNLIIHLYDQSGARHVTALASGVGNTGLYHTVIANNEGSDYRIRIIDANDPTVEDWSDGDFELVHNFRLSAPNGGEFWYATQTNAIQWISPGPDVLHVGDNVQLWFSADGGTNFSPAIASISTNRIGRNTYRWLTPSNDASLISETAVIAVSSPTPDPLAPTTYKVDFSDSIFTNAGIAITFPALGDGIKMGTIANVEWTAAGAGLGGVTIEFFNGANWTNVTTLAPCRAGTNSFPVELVAENPTQGARLRITANDDALVYGVSDPFTLADINIVSPVGGTPAERDRWQIDTTHEVKWTAGGAGDSVDIEYSTDPAHTNWVPIVMGYSNVNSSGAGIYTNVAPPWTILGPPSSDAIIRVRSVSQPDLFDLTEPFSISGVQIAEPNGGEAWEFAGTNTIRWLFQDSGAGISISIAYENNPSSNDYELVIADTLVFNRFFELTPGMLRRPSNFARMRITARNPPDAELLPMFDVSDDKFQLKGMKVEVPTNSAVYTLSTTVPQGLQWFSAGADDSSAEIYYSRDDGVTFDPVPLSVLLNQDDGPGTGLNQQPFSVPRTIVPSTKARLMVKAGSYEAISEPFTSRGVRFIRPAAGEMLDIGARDEVMQWITAGLSAGAYAYNDLSVTGVGGPYDNAAMPTNAFVAGSAMFWSIPADLDPTTNAVIRMRVTRPAEDTDVTMYSDPFTLRGIKVTVPGIGANWDHGATETVTYLAAGMGGGARASLYYSPDGIDFDLDNPIVQNDDIEDGANNVPWTIEATSELTRMPSTNAHVMVVYGSYTNVSHAFTLNGIKVTSPLGSDIWAVSDVTNTIRWAGVGTVDNYTINYTIWENGTPVDTRPIAAGISGNQYVWTMPNESVASNVTIQVTDGNFTGISEMFEIVPQPSVRIINPSPGDFWKVGTTNKIQWSKGGSMDNAFVLYYSTEPYTVTNELWRGAFDLRAGVYSFDWIVPFQLGPTKLIVTNQTSELVKDTFDDFDIAAKFDIEAFNTDLYALETHGVIWVTRGDVESVDLYYSTDLDRAPGSWKQINTEGPYSENIGHNKPATPYPWTLPNVKTDSMWVRVQDHTYPTERFDAAVPGPYDDLGPFTINYYSVVWRVFDAVNSNELDHLSVSDTSGWADSDLDSPILHEYPYGTWSTVWFREYFSDKVVFNWDSDGNKTNIVYMERSQMEPDYKVLADFTYNPPTTNFTVQAWIERGGQILENADECTVFIFDSDGNKIETVIEDETKQGVFWLTWDVRATAAARGETYDESDVFFAQVQIKFSGVTYSSGLTSTLRVAASGVTLGNIEANTAAVLDLVKSTGSNVTDLVTDSGIIRSNVNSIAAGMGLLLSEIGQGFSNVVGTVSNMSVDLSNSILPALDQVTNDIAILLPAVTNMTAAVSNVNESAAATLARILTRPTQVVDGETITILYKTRPKYGDATVGISVIPGGSLGMMSEVSDLGIYSAEVNVNWGVGTYTIVCEDPLAEDRMILDVVDQASLSAVPNMLVALSNRMEEVFGELTNVTAVIDDIENFRPLVEAISNDLRQMTFTVTNEISKIGELNDILTGIDKLTNSLANFDASSITNLDAQLIKLTNALSGVDWQDIRDLQGDMVIVTGALEGLDKLTTISGDVTNLIDSLDQISDVTNISAQLTYITNQLFGVAWVDIVDIRDTVHGVSNALKDIDIGSLSNLIGNVTNELGNLDWGDIDQLMADSVYTTNRLASLAGLDDLSTNIDSLTNAIHQMSAVTNLGPQIAELSNALGNVDWQDIEQLQSDMTATTNALGGLTELKDIGGTLTSLTNLPDRISALSNHLARVDWDDVDRLVADVIGVTNTLETLDVDELSDKIGDITNRMGEIDWADIDAIKLEMVEVTNSMSKLDDVVTQVGVLTNVAPQLETLAGSLDDADLPEIATGVQTITNTLAGFNWSTVQGDAVLSQDIWDMLDAKLGNVTDSADVSTFFGRLNQMTERLGALGSQTEEASRNAKMAKTKALEASSGIQALKTVIEEGDFAEALGKIEAVRDGIGEALAVIGGIPDMLPTEEYNQNMMTAADELLQWARADGWKGLEKLGLGALQEEDAEKEEGKVGPGVADAPEKATVEDLNRNMNNVKSSLDFMQKAVDEMRYKVTVESTLVGGG